MQAKPNRVQNKEIEIVYFIIRKRDKKRAGRGSHNVQQYIAALQSREGVA